MKPVDVIPSHSGAQVALVGQPTAMEVPAPVVTAAEDKPEIKPVLTPVPAPTPTPTPAPKPAPAAAPALPKTFDVTVSRTSTTTSLGMIVDNKNFVPGILVKRVNEGPAKQSGQLEIGDMITAIEGSGRLDAAKFKDMMGRIPNPTFTVHRHCWDVKLEKKSGQKLGVQFQTFEGTSFAVVTGITDGCEAASFNAAHPDKEFHAGDVIIGVNGSENVEKWENGACYNAFRDAATKETGTIRIRLLRRQ